MMDVISYPCWDSLIVSVCMGGGGGGGGMNGNTFQWCYMNIKASRPKRFGQQLVQTDTNQNTTALHHGLFLREIYRWSVNSSRKRPVFFHIVTSLYSKDFATHHEIKKFFYNWFAIFAYIHIRRNISRQAAKQTLIMKFDSMIYNCYAEATVLMYDPSWPLNTWVIFLKVILFSNAANYQCYILVWNRFNNMTILSALLMLMAWYFSSRVSVAMVMFAHQCVSKCLYVKPSMMDLYHRLVLTCRC